MVERKDTRGRSPTKKPRSGKGNGASAPSSARKGGKKRPASTSPTRRSQSPSARRPASHNPSSQQRNGGTKKPKKQPLKNNGGRRAKTKKGKNGNGKPKSKKGGRSNSRSPTRNKPASQQNKTKKKKKRFKIAVNNRDNCRKRIIGVAVCILFIIVLSVVIWAATGRPDRETILDTLSNFDDVLDNFNLTNFQNGWDQDPFAGIGGSGGGDPRWAIQAGAPSNQVPIELHNALDSTWQRYFDDVVDDWNAGTPDVLQLSTKRVNVEPECTQPNAGNVMKVCNGNYGDSGWLGINLLVTKPQGSVTIIESSVAKMNDFYLRNADQYSKQYTMCHEIGHGFGLYHTDEDFDNVDLGNCLDYSNTPKNNLHPDASNFQTLQELYFPTRRRRTAQQEESSLASTSYLRRHEPSTVKDPSSTTTSSSSSSSGIRNNAKFQLEYDNAVQELQQVFDVHHRRQRQDQDNHHEEGSTTTTSDSGTTAIPITRWELIHRHSHGSIYQTYLTVNDGDDHDEQPEKKEETKLNDNYKHLRGGSGAGNNHHNYKLEVRILHA